MPCFSRVLRFASTAAAVLALSHCGSQTNHGTPSAESDGGAASDAEASGPCGARTGMTGQTMRTVMAGGQSRQYMAYLPQNLDPKKPVPLVYVFHGTGMTPQIMYDVTQYSTLADAQGIAVAFPAGQNLLDPWNVSDNGTAVCGYGNAVNNSNAVDFAFMDAIKADVAQDQCLDAAHTFVTGFSMGGYFTHHVGCDRKDVKAVAPHSGGTIADLSGCGTGHMPIIIFHGTADPLIAPGCDDPNSAAQSGFPPSATLWAAKNGCKTTSTMSPENGMGGGTGQCYLYDGCPADGQVELCTFNGMMHVWAGGPAGNGVVAYGAPTYASATQLEWAFWKKYAW